MRSKPAICYNTTKCCLIYSLLIVVITGTTTPTAITSKTSLHSKYGNKTEDRIEMTTIGRHYINSTIDYMSDKRLTGPSNMAKSRAKRSLLQLAGMIRCVAGCDPLSYKSYGCYCGFMGAGTPVDLIDRCCLQHDWCYTESDCPTPLTYFLQYQWTCIAPGYAHCDVVQFGGRRERCSYQLCQCDRAFAKCLSRMPCPNDKPICQSSPIIAIQNIIVG